MNYTLELVIVPVSDVDRAKAFYTEQAGFDLHVDHRAGDDFRVVQLNPPGSACSIIGAHSLEDRREPICDESLALKPAVWINAPSGALAGRARLRPRRSPSCS